VANLAALRQTPPGGFTRRLMMLASRTANAGRPCPGCPQRMIEVPTISAPGMPAPLKLDVCPRCELVWFDPREHEAWLAAPRDSAADVNLPPETRQAMEAAGVNAARWREMIDRRLAAQPVSHDYEMEDATFAFGLGLNDHDIGWKLAWVFLGLPVEVMPPPLRSKPWATWSLAGVIVVSSIMGLAYAPQSLMALGMVPSQLWRYGGLTLVTSFFLHGSLWHLLSNMYFLLVFGDDAEDQLGRGAYLALIAFSAVAGGLLHAGLHPSSTQPAIGASGGISGVIAFYALRFPRRRLRLMLGLFAFHRVIVGRLVDVRASALMVLWVIVQAVSLAVPELTEEGPKVAYLAHLGGAATGFVFWAVARSTQGAVASRAT
jgi:membrane associated rhomboid family serine protease/Zn-finger nucleic acid-binding protein